MIKIDCQHRECNGNGYLFACRHDNKTYSHCEWIKVW